MGPTAVLICFKIAHSNELCYHESMKDVSNRNFGILIAYVLPGFIVLWGLEPWSESVSGWLNGVAVDGPTIGGFLYVTIVSVGMGQVISTTRWLLVDSLHHATGVPKPELRFHRLSESVAGLEQLIEMHYRHYQWHANGLVALTVCGILRGLANGFSTKLVLIVCLINVLLLFGSRDTLSKYYRRAEQLLGTVG